MNKLPSAKRAQILQMLCEGSSMRSVSRVADVSINTVSKLLVDAGKACAAFHDEHVRNVKAKRVQCDEIWSFTYAKAKNVATAKSAPEDAGDTWTWTALDADSKLIVSWLVGGRDAGYATEFMQDVAERLANRVQITTGGHRAYLDAVEDAFGSDVERQNLTMRMHMRRFTRLTNGFSKKFENHMYMVALYTVWYNFVRVHKSLRMSPAMAAGVSQLLWSMEEIADLVDAAAPKPDRRGPYKKRAA